MTDTPTPLGYESPAPSRVPWAAVVSCAIGAFAVLWVSVGWGHYLNAVARDAGPVGMQGYAVGTAYAARVLLGFLVSATTPGAMVGLFLAAVALQRPGGGRRRWLGWVGAGLNGLALAAGVGGFAAAFLFGR